MCVCVFSSFVLEGTWDYKFIKKFVSTKNTSSFVAPLVFR